jgi:choline dehydrogenase-like flavoprotein
MLTSTFAEGGGFVSTDGNSDNPDIQFHFYPSKIKRNMSISSILGHGFGLQSCLLRPRSKGHIELQSADPDQPPLIDPKYFSDPEDLEVMVKGMKIARKVLACDAFKPHLREEIEPGAHVQSDDDIREYIRNTITTIFHPAGTCKMGPDSDPMAVVDERLRVHGMEGLRVADCSIMPDIVSANTNVPAIAIGEKAADMIAEDQDLGVHL